ncbi:hypothetical protein F5Y16DRAFT_356737 [Xylariaceae sp. FL0255]|nr:hypothetical protein F5Y16DRAFT_356737 [Xylariaceae sp. FL0255]
MAPTELQFIVSTGQESTSSRDRKLIRRHVMKGKNLGKQRPLGSKQFRESQQQLPPPNSEQATVEHVHIAPISLDRDGCFNGLVSTSIPRDSFPGHSTMTLADTVKPEVFKIVLELSSISKKLLFALEPCMFFDRRAEHWVAPLATDPAYLHVSVFSALYFYGVLVSQNTSIPTQLSWYHYKKALSLLHERLQHDDDRIRLSNSTLNTILTFVGHAFTAGDLVSAKNHLEGMRRVIDLKGGWSTLEGNEKLITEILRADLGMTLHTGDESVFISHSTGNWPYPNMSVFLNQPRSQSRGLCDETRSAATKFGIEPKSNLGTALHAMSEFCSVINLACETKQRISVRMYLDSMASIMYRLLNMRFDDCSRHETIRLGLLCFSCGVFLQWQNIGMSYLHLTSIVRQRFMEHFAAQSTLDFRKSNLWLLMTSAVALLGQSNETWWQPLIKRAMKDCKVESWAETREIISSLMWIGVLHDQQGARIVDMVQAVAQPIEPFSLLTQPIAL